jgi:hypothetical protein
MSLGYDFQFLHLRHVITEGPPDPPTEEILFCRKLGIYYTGYYSERKRLMRNRMKRLSLGALISCKKLIGFKRNYTMEDMDVEIVLSEILNESPVFKIKILGNFNVWGKHVNEINITIKRSFDNFWKSSSSDWNFYLDKTFGSDGFMYPEKETGKKIYDEICQKFFTEIRNNSENCIKGNELILFKNEDRI